MYVRIMKTEYFEMLVDFKGDFSLEEIAKTYDVSLEQCQELTAEEYDKAIAIRQIDREMRATNSSTTNSLRAILLGTSTMEDYQKVSNAETRSQLLLKEIAEIKGVPFEAKTESAKEIQARIQAEKLLVNHMQKQLAQTISLTNTEFAILAQAKLFNEWKPATAYEKGERVLYGNFVYEVQQDVTSIETQVPSDTGMLAVYRPISVDVHLGQDPDGSMGNPYTYIHGMDVRIGGYYTFEGQIYLAKADMLPCIWDPGAQGIWQWELVFRR